MTRTIRSEHAANVALQPQTLQAMRNLSALQTMNRDGWNVGRTFTRPSVRPAAAHTVATRSTIDQQVNECSRAAIGYALAVGMAIASFLVLVS